MNGFVLLLPLLFIRYGLLYAVNKDALQRAAFFPPMVGNEKIAYWIYQLATVLIFVTLCFLRVRTDAWYFLPGLVVYLGGLAIFAWATVNFASPSSQGINQSGLYRVSRNPMYIGYFVTFLGCALLTKSVLLLALVLVFQASAHFIILAEERWCREELGEAYIAYTQKVRRYL